MTGGGGAPRIFHRRRRRGFMIGGGGVGGVRRLADHNGRLQFTHNFRNARRHRLVCWR